MVNRRRFLPPFSVLDRYILREFLRYYLLALIGFVAFILLIDGFEKIDIFIDYDATAAQVLGYYANVAPKFLILVGPVAPLLATFLCLGSMTRFKELTAIAAAGISLYRVLLPLVGVGLVITALTFVLGEFVMPLTNRRAEEIMNVEIKGRSGRNLGSRSNVTYLGQGNRFYIIRRYDVPRESMVGLIVQEYREDRLTRRIDAARAVWREGNWLLLDGIEREFDAAGTERASPFDSLRAAFPEIPADFASSASEPDEMTYPELQAYANRVKQSGSSVEQYETELHLRTSFPFVNLIMILIASSLAVQIRRGGIAIGFGFSLGIAFAYWSLIRAGQVLGNSGTLPPPVAAWLGNIVFLVVAIYLLVRTPK